MLISYHKLFNLPEIKVKLKLAHNEPSAFKLRNISYHEISGKQIACCAEIGICPFCTLQHTKYFQTVKITSTGSYFPIDEVDLSATQLYAAHLFTRKYLNPISGKALSVLNYVPSFVLNNINTKLIDWQQIADKELKLIINDLNKIN